MRKRFWILLAAAVLAAAGAVSSVALAAGESGRRQTDQELRQAGYVLMEHEGGIGVWAGGELLYTADIDVSRLRAADRELLRGGIETVDYEDVLRLLEDFGA